MDTETPEFEADYASLKGDVALMRANCVTKPDLAAMEQRLGLRFDKRFDEVDRRFDRTDRRVDHVELVLGHRIDGAEHKLERQIDALASNVVAFTSKIEAVLPFLATKEDVLRSANRIYTIMICAWLTMFLGFVGVSMTMANMLKPAPSAHPAAIEQSRAVPAASLGPPAPPHGAS
jgi:hypothetical protein